MGYKMLHAPVIMRRNSSKIGIAFACASFFILSLSFDRLGLRYDIIEYRVQQRLLVAVRVCIGLVAQTPLECVALLGYPQQKSVIVHPFSNLSPVLHANGAGSECVVCPSGQSLDCAVWSHSSFTGEWAGAGDGRLDW